MDTVRSLSTETLVALVFRLDRSDQDDVEQRLLRYVRLELEWRTAS